MRLDDRPNYRPYRFGHSIRRYRLGGARCTRTQPTIERWHEDTRVSTRQKVNLSTRTPRPPPISVRLEFPFSFFHSFLFFPPPNEWLSSSTLEMGRGAAGYE